MTTQALEAAIALHFSQDARAAYEWQLKYNAYIASEAWQHKRLQKLLSLVGVTAHRYESIEWLVHHASGHHYPCEKCGCKGTHAEIWIHHRRYQNLGQEPLDDLVALCGFCHQALHSVARATGFALEVVTTHIVGPLRESKGNGRTDAPMGVASPIENRPSSTLPFPHPPRTA